MCALDGIETDIGGAGCVGVIGRGEGVQGEGR